MSEEKVTKTTNGEPKKEVSALDVIRKAGAARQAFLGRIAALDAERAELIAAAKEAGIEIPSELDAKARSPRRLLSDNEKRQGAAAIASKLTGVPMTARQIRPIVELDPAEVGRFLEYGVQANMFQRIGEGRSAGYRLP